MAKTFTTESVLMFEESMGSDKLPYASSVNPAKKGVRVDVQMCLDGPGKLLERGGSSQPGDRSPSGHRRAGTWGNDRVLAEAL